MPEEKQLVWVGGSLDDLKAFPDDVKDFVGFALRYANPVRCTQTLNP